MLIRTIQHETVRREQRNPIPKSNTWPHARAQETKEHVASRKAAAGWKGRAGRRDQYKPEKMKTYPLLNKRVYLCDGAPSPRRSNNVTAARGGGRCNESRDEAGKKTLWQAKHGGMARVQGCCAGVARGGCHNDGGFTPAAGAGDCARKCAQPASEHAPQHASGTSCGRPLKAQALDKPLRRRL